MARKIVILCFILLALVQLYVPGSLILEMEGVINTGNSYKFKTMPVDPNDPFRGKYITLGFEESWVAVDTEKEWLEYQLVYAFVSRDDEGFAVIDSISNDKPTEKSEYFEANINRVNIGKVRLEMPFDRYYMEESKAYAAEQLYRSARGDSSEVAYALVHIKNGQAVLKDVMIDGKSIKDLVEKTLD